MKVVAAHHPIIQKEVDELLSKGVIEPSSGGASFYSSVYLTLSSLIVICIYHLLRCLLSNMSGSLFSMVIMLSSLISRMLINIFLLLSIIIIFYDLFGTICHISGRFYLVGWLQSLGFSQPSLNLSCSFAIARVSVLLSILITFWSWYALSWQVRGLTHFVFLIGLPGITY